MIVDSSALTEQVVADVLSSAFDSAGQRCSALRLLCIQRDVAAQTIEMLKGAMAALQTGDPTRLSTDVGPVIDASAKRAIDMHIESLRDAGCTVTQTDLSVDAQQGTFVPPTLIEIPNLHALEHEVFGPVCHVIQYDRAALPALIDQINALGFGLTMGLHTRSDATIEMVKRKAAVGNLYINRNQVGAVVGVQPFGGEGLSGTGPKAGGPLYLYRLLAQRPDTEINRIITPALNNGIDLKGPTGEHNQYRCAARAHILCLADDSEDLMAQTRAVLAIGGTPIWPTERLELTGELARDLVGQLIGCDDWAAPDARFDLVLLNGSKQQALHVQQVLARKTGAIVGLWRGEPGARQIPLERLVIERSVSNNTTASGGNTSLMRL
jgi:RHH-type proline utilization regulon transcriptional repressor/proline dehydrogenase/delta 1-pyrroline-5-carboxylate dehydrogenase